MVSFCKTFRQNSLSNRKIIGFMAAISYLCGPFGDVLVLTALTPDGKHVVRVARQHVNPDGRKFSC